MLPSEDERWRREPDDYNVLTFIQHGTTQNIINNKNVLEWKLAQGLLNSNKKNESYGKCAENIKIVVHVPHSTCVKHSETRLTQKCVWQKAISLKNVLETGDSWSL